MASVIRLTQYYIYWVARLHMTMDVQAIIFLLFFKEIFAQSTSWQPKNFKSREKTELQVQMVLPSVKIIFLKDQTLNLK